MRGFVYFCLIWVVFGSGLYAQEGVVTSSPLVIDESSPGSHQLFEELEPRETGLADFKNDFSSPHVWGKHWRTYLFGAIGTGIALGDVDGDGLPDLYAVSKNERSRLYRNLGDFRFEDMSEESGIDDTLGGEIDKFETSCGGVAFADVNNDGHLDLYLSFLGAPNQLWVNDGTGRFEERAKEWGIDVNSASMMGYFADYDSDGLLDLYVATNHLQEGDEYVLPKPDHLFRNTGSRFVETTIEAGISGVGHAHSAVWWDYNQDGLMDLYVANDFATVDWLYQNNGDGTFKQVLDKTAPRAPYYGMGSDFGDVNGDGLYDFWVADMAPSDRSRYKRTLESHMHVYETEFDSLPHQYMQNMLLLNMNSQRFVDVGALAGLDRTDWTWAVRLVDMDSDGRLDAFATNGMLRNFNDGDLGMRQRGQNNMRTFAQIFKPTPVLNEKNLVYRNQGNIRFEEMGTHWGLDKLGVSFGAAFGDLDRDGSLDLVLSNFREPPSVYRSRSKTGARVLIELRGKESNHFGVGAQLEIVAGGSRQVNTLIPHRGYMSSDEPIVHFGLGEAKSIDRLTIRWPSGIVQELKNLPVNHRYVIAERGGEMPLVTKPHTRFKKVAVNFPDSASRNDPGADEFKQQPLLPFQRERLTGDAAAADLNGDGATDLILGGTSGQGTTVLLGGENFAFKEEWSLDLEEDFPSSDAGIALGDFNGDNNLDLITVSGGSSLDDGDPGYEDRLYLGNGEGGFIRDFESVLSSTAVSNSAVASGDFDADGILDLFVGGGTVPGRYPEEVSSNLWKGLNGGAFEWVDSVPSQGRVVTAQWKDLFNDGFPELIVLREWAAPELWHNENGKLILEEDALGGSELSGLWSSMAVGDFDGDGRHDIAVGNLGWNNGGLWNASGGSRRLWWKPDARRVRLLGTHDIEDKEWPLVWWHRLKEAIPGRIAKAATYTQFASKTAGELFGDFEEQEYQSLEINEARSGVFWQLEEGRFAFRPLPIFGQSGRIVSLLAEDIDGDGLSDLVASIEPPNVVPWTGRKEQGHLALFFGSTDRQLKEESTLKSGLDIGANSPRQLLWGDFDGDQTKELLVVMSEGDPQVFRVR